MSRLRPAVLTTVAAGGVLALGTVAAVAATGASATSASSGAAMASPAGVLVLTADASDDTDAGPRGGRHGLRWWAGLTDEQQACLRDAGPTRSAWPLAADERDALREQMQQSATACGVELPDPADRPVLRFWQGLTDEQQQCLADADVTRPVGPLDRDEREQRRADVRDAMEACGVEPPERPSRPGRSDADDANAPAGYAPAV